MSTHVSVFQSFFCFFLHHFLFAKLAKGKAILLCLKVSTRCRLREETITRGSHTRRTMRTTTRRAVSWEPRKRSGDSNLMLGKNSYLCPSKETTIFFRLTNVVVYVQENPFILCL